MQALILIFLFCFGLFMIIKPDWLWKLDNFLDVKGGEPTDFYLVSTQLGRNPTVLNLLFYICLLWSG